MRRIIVALVAAVATVLVAGPAGAGEITGNGEETPIKSRQEFPDAPAGPANSFCAFSGLNDDPAEDGNRTQSWGTGVADAPVEERVFFATEGLIQEFGPGTECRGGFPTL
jgi:hypothetical protein